MSVKVTVDAPDEQFHPIGVSQKLLTVVYRERTEPCLLIRNNPNSMFVTVVDESGHVVDKWLRKRYYVRTEPTTFTLEVTS